MEKNFTSVVKIAIVGTESTGKSSLAQALASYFNEPWVPEIARNYVTNLKEPYQLQDIERMAQLQIAEEQVILPQAKQFLFCDTSLLVHKIWAQFVFKNIPSSIIDLYHPQSYGLHLLCDIDIPWEYDPLREHPTKRKELFDLYENDLKRSGVKYQIISGLAQQRFDNAIQTINNLRHQIVL